MSLVQLVEMNTFEDRFILFWADVSYFVPHGN